MKVGFLIIRNTYYKFFGPLIHELSKKNKVNCYLFDFDGLHNGLKSKQKPTFENIPPIIAKAHFKSFSNYKDIINDINNNCDFVFSLETQNYCDESYSSKDIKLKSNIKWITLQHGIDTFISHLDYLDKPDHVIYYSEFWKNCLKKLISKTPGNNIREYISKVDQNSLPIGNVQFDTIKILKNKKELKNKYGFKKSDKILLFLPPSTTVFKPLTLKNYLTFQLGKIINNKNGYFVRPFPYKTFFESIIKLSKEHNFKLVIKARDKSYLPKSLINNIEYLFFDEDYYPSTMLELLSISDLCLSTTNSTTVLEAASLKVPFISLSNIDDYLIKYSNLFTKVKKLIFNDSIGGLFNYPGVSYKVSFNKIIANDFNFIRNIKTDKKENRDYLDKYINYNNWDSSNQLINFINKKYN